MLVSISKCYKTGEFPNPSKLPFIPFEPTYRLNLTIKCQTQASTTIPIPHPILQNNLSELVSYRNPPIQSLNISQIQEKDGRLKHSVSIQTSVCTLYRQHIP